MERSFSIIEKSVLMISISCFVAILKPGEADYCAINHAFFAAAAKLA